MSDATNALPVIGAVFAGVSLVISGLSLVVSFVTRRAAALEQRHEHVRGVTLFHQRINGQVTATHHDELVVRNDGRHAVTVLAFGVAYGNRWRRDRRQPEVWDYQHLTWAQLLPPGAELRVDAPDPVSDVPYIGPWATIADALGRKWEVTETTRREIVDQRDRRPRRRDAWFEHRRWWLRVDQTLEMWWLRRAEARPWRFPWLPLLLGFVWGWRAGAGPCVGMPFDAPLGWRYAPPGAHFDIPEVPPPTYWWRPASNQRP